MSMTLDELRDAALQLPTEERRQLADDLYASTDGDEDPAIDRESIDEAKARYEELRSGTVRAESLDEVLAALRAPLG
jgi:hypothetical protein